MISTSTSSSSAPGRGAVRSPTGWRPSGKRVLILERGGYLPRESGTTGPPPPSSSRAKYRAPGVLVRQARQPVPPRGQLLRRGQHQVLRRRPLPAPARGLRRAAPPRRHLPGLARSATRTWSPTTPRPSTSTSCTGGTARTPPKDRPARSTPIPPVEHEPRIQQLSDDLEKAGPAPVPPADRREPHPGRRTGRATHDSVCIRCDRVDGFPCLVSAKSDAQVICVDPALKYDNVTMVTEADVRRLETDPTGRTVTRVVAELEDGTTDGIQRRHRGGRLPARSTPPSCCCVRPTTGTPAAWPTARTWWDATTCGTTTWP